MDVHIIRRGGKKWAVRKPEARKAMKLFKSLKEAEEFARALPEIRQIVIHRKDGSVARTITIIRGGGYHSTEIEFFSRSLDAKT